MTAPARQRPHRWSQQIGAARLDLATDDQFTPGQRRVVRIAEVVAQCVGVTAAILRNGLREPSTALSIELGATVIVSLAILLVCMIVRDRASLARETFRQRHLFRFALLVSWIVVSASIVLVGPDTFGFPVGTPVYEAWFSWSDSIIVLRALIGLIGLTRGAASGLLSPALLLVGTFAVLITVGTLLLLLPKCRAHDAPRLEWVDQVRVAAFTATSASCVTGLIVVPTAGEHAYWSRTGQTVILILIQVGGLGIMTCGAFFALMTSRSLRLRETATLREIFDPDQPVNVRRMLFAILAFTLGSELIGAVLMSTMWPEKPFGERAYFSVYYAVSAFCNAGFDLSGHSFMGDGDRWQVGGVLAALVVFGGLGFGTHYNLAHVAVTRLRWRSFRLRTPALPFTTRGTPGLPARLTISTRLVLVMTFILLVSGTTWNLFFEALPGGTLHDESISERFADAWFQSVVSRTAGFNTVDLADLRPATKLFFVVLMFVGAAPVSTGGGVKVTAVAVTVLAIVAIMRGRPRTEAFGRTIGDEVVRRAMTVVAIGGATLIAVTLLLAAFENESDFQLIDLMYEASSACSTVGVSTGITSQLTPASQVVLIVAMFLGRVGPLTLLLGLAGQRQTVDYEYPEERVTLG